MIDLQANDVVSLAKQRHSFPGWAGRKYTPVRSRGGTVKAYAAFTYGRLGITWSPERKR
jgi:hypothetical protein